MPVPAFRAALLLPLLGLEVPAAAANWGPRQFTSLVTFGDSYTDDTRFSYFQTHNNSAPPVGWVEPEANISSSGGYIWPHYVAAYHPAIKTRYNYAVSGATCSNAIIARPYDSAGHLYPSVREYEVPAFTADAHYTDPTTHQPFLNLPADETVYALWIGTNDLGNNAFLTDSQLNNATVVDYVDCVYEVLDGVRAKYFILMNVIPLQLTPLYATPENGGIGPSKYWPDKPANLTEISGRMEGQVVLVNEAFRWRTAAEVVLNQRWPGVEVAVFDVYSLIQEIYHNPTQYLNGSAPANVTGYEYHCNINGTDCVKSDSPDSFLWFDALHPSERTDQIIAEEFIKVVSGESRFAEYWSGE
ncbi:SGNH/GDSL hydrolase family protein [Aspergillus saccharolyticus JOP 1030-1]|uniref:GDSL lipase/acylhydrolase family protein n=1 Tax=Aspergillus saccharolyticus JOP 1030-1 TaxID=1450539 RepID=A0A318Z196_9EURO|nr:GDSL lipase/acylhydrolase family protein [Aspergillus saccharolyticus JOP 1030-1]PYH41065.1 GDSL lipase/acylhydrolase family protein [Aspergillus saccharolyticus JOP 1030-1]